MAIENLNIHDIVIREVGLECLDEIGRLRASVWQPIATSLMLTDGKLADDYDYAARHWAAFHRDRIVGAGRVSVGCEGDLIQGPLINSMDPEPLWPAAELMRLVVADAYRLLGIGKRLDSIRIEAARTAGARAVYGVTSTRATMLQRIGFEPLGTVSREKYMQVFGILPATEGTFMRLVLD